MKTELTHVSDVKKRLTVEVPASDVTAVYETLVRRHRRNMSIPGFRPGHAPLELVQTRLGAALDHEAAEEIVEQFGRDACGQEGLKAVWTGIDLPEGTEHLPHPTRGQDYSFALNVEVVPTVEPHDYVGVDVPRPAVEISDEDVEKELDGLRRIKGELVDVIDRPSAAEDYVGVVLEGKVGDEVIVPGEFQVIQVGDEKNLPEFNAVLTGRKTDDEVAFTVDYATENADPKFGGKTVAYKGTVKAVKRMELPPLDEAFAKALGGEEATLDTLRGRLREGLTARKTAEADDVARRHLAEKLLDAHPFDVPDALVEGELREALDRLGRRLASQGVDVEKLEIDWNKVIETERERARLTVREALLLDAIAEKEAEHVVVSPEDVEATVQRMARDMNQPVGKVRQFLAKEGRMSSLQRELRRSKCLDWLLAQSHII